jgi:hypothetical protein
MLQSTICWLRESCPVCGDASEYVEVDCKYLCDTWRASRAQGVSDPPHMLTTDEASKGLGLLPHDYQDPELRSITR